MEQKNTIESIIQQFQGLTQSQEAIMDNLDQTLANDVLRHISRFSPISGRESISFLLQEMRSIGWKNLGNLDDFASTLQALGFTVEIEQHGGQVHRYITI